MNINEAFKKLKNKLTQKLRLTEFEKNKTKVHQ